MSAHEVSVVAVAGPRPDETDLEIVERKGLGHPDSICDAVADRISQALCRAYVERAGAVLHHNADKALLIAGRAEQRFGGGRIREPMRLVVGDRATAVPGLDLPGLVVETARAWFREALPRVDPARHLVVQVELRPGSAELTRLFEDPGSVGANDTSVGVGFAPLTETERLVLEAERWLNSAGTKAARPWVGEDVKVLGVRRGRRLELTVAAPLVDSYVASEATYFDRKAELREVLEAHLSSGLDRLDGLSVVLNALDHPGRGAAGTYLSVIGTSAEDADSGQVGRGNRANGLITFHRPMSLEAIAGKNPVNHVGKIYGVLANLVARRIHREVPGVTDVAAWIWSRIGQPVDRPAGVSLQVRLAPGAALGDVAPRASEVVDAELRRIAELRRELELGRHAVC